MRKWSCKVSIKNNLPQEIIKQDMLLKIFSPLFLPLFQNKKEWTTKMWNTDKSQIHYAKWQKSCSKRFVSVDFMYVAFCKRQNHRDRKHISVATGWAWKEGLTRKGDTGTLWGDATVLYLHRSDSYTQLYVYQVSQNCPFKRLFLIEIMSQFYW